MSQVTMEPKKPGAKPPAISSTHVPDWIRPVVDKVAQALGEKPALIYGAAAVAFAQLTTEEQFKFLNPVKVEHANRVKAVQG